MATTYTLDLNSGLTQVLADGSNTYLYGYTRIAQVSHDAAGYFLGDALGSVRQVTGPEAEIVLMQSYSPYGETTVSFGEFETDYSYTGEMTDESGLINLRARMYDPGSGRFLTMDSWNGDYQNPITLIKWVYANANPVRYSDPSGLCFDFSSWDAFWSNLGQPPLFGMCYSETTPVEDINVPIVITSPTMTQTTLSTLTPTSTCTPIYIPTETSTPTPVLLSNNQRVQYYGIALIGFSDSNINSILNALDNMNKFMPGIALLTNGSVYTFTYDPAYYGGTTSGNGDIKFHSPGYAIPFQNIYHEVAHSINFKSQNFFVEKLTQKKIFTDDGTYVMGGPSDSYQRNSEGYASLRVNDPVGFDVDAQQHPGNYPCPTNDPGNWCAEGNTPSEEWADLVANYVANNFTQSPAGIARRDWVTSVWNSYINGNK